MCGSALIESEWHQPETTGNCSHVTNLTDSDAGLPQGVIRGYPAGGPPAGPEDAAAAAQSSESSSLPK